VGKEFFHLLYNPSLVEKKKLFKFKNEKEKNCE
jgi:hypothetical protein